MTLKIEACFLITFTKEKKQKRNTMKIEKAILAGGCFWGVEELIGDLPGVTDTVAGYTGAMFPTQTIAIMALMQKPLQ